MKWKKLPKPKKGAWYVKVRGSYLPCSWQGWLLHLALIGLAVGAFFANYSGRHSMAFVITSTMADLYVLGSMFTLIARKKS